MVTDNEAVEAALKIKEYCTQRAYGCDGCAIGNVCKLIIEVPVKWDAESIDGTSERKIIGPEKLIDKIAEQLWLDFVDVPMNPATEKIEAPFLHFDAGTLREDVWHWFDRLHSCGVAYLFGLD